MLLLDVQEAIEQRCDVAGQFAFMANELARMNVAGEHAHAQGWAQLYQALDDVLRDLVQMVPLFRLDRGILYRTYTAMRILKARWLTLRISGHRVVETEPDGLDPEIRQKLHADETCLTRIVEQLKRLVALAP